MKKVVISLFVALLATVGVKAQQIAVVSESGTTSMYQTLPEAIEGADPGSVIYLPGGGFQISDDVKITKKLTIIGIGHKANGENADGNTIISGNLFFDGGSDYSAVMGCYISGDVNIGNDGSSVNNVTVRYCNLNSMQVKNNTCTGTIVNQNYVRSPSLFQYAGVTFKNNICNAILYISGGTISYNIFAQKDRYYAPICEVNNSTISSNFFLVNSSDTGGGYLVSRCYNDLVFDNMGKEDCGDKAIVISGEVDWTDVFVNYNGGAITPASDFHFKGDYKQYENQVGIYAGDGFSDSGMAPVPYILAKKVDAQTDASGKLNVKIRVKAGE